MNNKICEKAIKNNKNREAYDYIISLKQSCESNYDEFFKLIKKRE
jgi:hypothetical protein